MEVPRRLFERSSSLSWRKTRLGESQPDGRPPASNRRGSEGFTPAQKTLVCTRVLVERAQNNQGGRRTAKDMVFRHLV